MLFIESRAGVGEGDVVAIGAPPQPATESSRSSVALVRMHFTVHLPFRL